MEGKDGQTEPATLKRREEERRKGNLCVSPEVTSLLVLIVGIVTLRFEIPTMFCKLQALLVHVTRFEQLSAWNTETVSGAFTGGCLGLGALLAPVIIPIILAGIVGNMIQTRPYFSSEALKLNFGALSPSAGIKSLFSPQAAMRMVLGLLKVILIVLVAYFLIRKDLQVLVGLQNVACAPSIEWVFRFLYQLSLTVAVIFTGLAVLDWCFRKWQYEKKMMMSIQDVKKEHTESEPSALMRGARSKKMRQLTLARMMADVPNANVVITNPDHVAVAIQYDAQTMSAPKVTAKGLRLMAERIKQVARENNVPIVRRPETARALYKYVEVGHPIPGPFFAAVAEVLAYLHRLGRNIGLHAA
jgi:flagellar biosynthetic protein FlhB